MPQALPSDVVKLIDAFFRHAASGSPDAEHFVTFANAAGVSALIELVEQLPDETLQLSGEEYSYLIWAVASLRHLARRLEAGHTSAGGGWPVPSFRGEDAIALLRRLLAKCPDEGIRTSTSGLEFIDDEELRASLRRDISSSEAALNTGQWKAATVLAGSVVEALLLWNVKRDGNAQRRFAVQAAVTNLKFSGSPDDWVLDQGIKIAQELGDISRETADQARLAKDFRNLIHPGREVRKRMRCDRGTAHAAFAALNLVIADLERRCASGGK
jgi:hypothetical protein